MLIQTNLDLARDGDIYFSNGKYYIVNISDNILILEQIDFIK